MSIFGKIGRVITWPVRAATGAAKNAAEDIAMAFFKQFAVKAIYGFLAGLTAVLTQAGGIHSDDKGTQIVWPLIIGGLTGVAALLKKIAAHALGVDPSQTLGK